MHVYCCNTDNDVGGDDSQQGDMLKCHLEVLHVAFDGREKKEMGDNGRREEVLTSILVQKIVRWCGTSNAHVDLTHQQGHVTYVLNVNRNRGDLMVVLNFQYVYIIVD